MLTCCDSMLFSFGSSTGSAGRSDILSTLWRNSRPLGVAFISLRDNLGLTTPSGRLMFQIIGAMAEFERSLIVEQVKAGMRNAQTKGKRIGRPPRTYLTHEDR